MSYGEANMASYSLSANGHNGDFAMQKYLLLHNQHEELRQQLYVLCPAYTASSTAVTSPSVSPTRSIPLSPSFGSRDRSSSRNHRRSSAGASMRSSHSASPPTLEPVLDEALVEEMLAGEQKLHDLNEGIKRALTELLNCETVRKDRSMRLWVQSRLMETEQELRSGRRRRSN